MLLQILDKLPLQSKLHCALAVCKSWRTLKQVELLWKTLELGDSWSDGYNKFGVHPEHPMKISNSGLARLLTWVPAAKVETFVLFDDHKKIGADALKKALGALPSLTTLHIQGKCVTAATIKHVAKQSFMMNLIDLQFGPVLNKVSFTDKLLLVQKASRLEKLTIMYAREEQRTAIAALLNALRAARGPGTKPLLTKLSLSDYCGGTCTWNELFDMFAALPELEDVEIGAVVWSSMPVTSLFAHPPLLRLRHLRIKRFLGYEIDVRNHLSTEFAAQVLRALLAAAPQLEVLSITHGSQYSHERVHTNGPWPGVGGSLAGLPKTLTRLFLSDFHLEPDAFDLCDLPNLEQLVIRNAGIHARALAESLEERCPRLCPQNVAFSVRMLSGTLEEHCGRSFGRFDGVITPADQTLAAARSADAMAIQ